MKWLALGVSMIAVASCYTDETIHGYGAADTTWRLTELNTQPFNSTATLTFPDKAKIAGAGPCNRFSASQHVPYPWFDAGPIASTRMACPDMADEADYFRALSKASLSEVLGDTLILSDEDGVLLVFKSGG